MSGLPPLRAEWDSAKFPSLRPYAEVSNNAIHRLGGAGNSIGAEVFWTDLSGLP